MTNPNRLLENIYSRKYWPLLAVLLLSLVYLFLNPGLWDTGTQCDDNRTGLMAYMTMFGYNQFEDDVLAKSALAFRPLGHRLVYKLSSYFVDIMVSAKIFQIVLFYGFIYLGFKIGSLFLGNIGGVFSVANLITSEWVLGRIAGGQPRSFGMVLCMALLYMLLRKNKSGVLLIACLGSLFYPLAMVISLVSFSIMESKNLINKGFSEYIKTEKTTFYKFGIAILFILLIMVPYKLSIKNVGMGDLYSFNEIKTNPHFHEGGRLGAVVPFPIAAKYLGYLVSVAEGRRLYSSNVSKKLPHEIPIWNKERGDPLGLVIYIILPLLLFFIGRFKFPEGLIIFLLGSLVSYCIASLIAFSLYMPLRYATYPVVIIISQMYPIGLGHSLQTKHKDVTKNNRLIIIVILTLVFCLKMLQLGGGISKNYALSTKILPDQEKLYKFVQENVPQDKMLAGALKDMDSIPLFAKRRVLVNYESSVVWFKKFNQNVLLPRTKAICNAYFASDPLPVKQLRDKFGVDYIVVRKKYLRSQKYPDGYMFMPFNKLGKKLFANNKGAFFLANPPTDIISYEDDNYFLINLAKLGT